MTWLRHSTGYKTELVWDDGRVVDVPITVIIAAVVVVVCVVRVSQSGWAGHVFEEAAGDVLGDSLRVCRGVAVASDGGKRRR